MTSDFDDEDSVDQEASSRRWLITVRCKLDRPTDNSVCFVVESWIRTATAGPDQLAETSVPEQSRGQTGQPHNACFALPAAFTVA